MAFKDTARELKDKIVEFVLEQAGEAIPGEEKLVAAAAKAAEWLDKNVKYEKLGPVGVLLETVDGPVFKAAAQFLVQWVYDELHDAGRV